MFPTMWDLAGFDSGEEDEIDLVNKPIITSMVVSDRFYSCKFCGHRVSGG